MNTSGINLNRAKMNAVNDEKPRIILEEFKVSHNLPTKSTLFDEPFDMKTFKKRFRVVIIRHNSTEMEFDLIGIDPSIANAFRRTMLSEVPTMAVERVEIMNNTSIMRDEVLAHRLGLIPFKADPRLFEFRPQDSVEASEQDTLEFELKIKCSKNHKNEDKDGNKESYLSQDLYVNSEVYSEHITWLPIGGQSNMYSDEDVGPVHKDILINKLRPSQEINLKMIVVKGIGKDHAKFSPVCTASYRILPEIHMIKEVYGEKAERLQKCFAPGVIEIESDGATGQKVARVASARYDTCSRNVFRYEDLKDSVVLSRVKDHFIFTVESSGAMTPDVIFVEAIKCLKTKIRGIIDSMNK